jgi:hypothetical protein
MTRYPTSAVGSKVPDRNALSVSVWDTQYLFYLAEATGILTRADLTGVATSETVAQQPDHGERSS